MKHLKNFLFILNILLCPFSLWGQKQNIRFRHLTVDAGLSHSNVLCILQDHLGYLWFGTYDGLNKYDGYDFTIYRSNDKDLHSISSNEVQSLIEGHDGNLWIATSEGLCLYKREQDNFIRYNKKNGYPLKDMYIINIFQDSNNKLWIATRYNGLFEYDPGSNQSTQYTHNENDPKSISSNHINQVYEDSKHNLWVTTNGLDLFDRKTKTFVHYKHEANNPKSLAGAYTSSVTEDSNGNLWIGSITAGLMCTQLNELQKCSFTNYQYDPQNRLSLCHNCVLALQSDKHGNLWIGTENGGLDFFQKDDKTFFHFINNENDPNSINNNSIYSLFKDGAGDLWIGTYSGGINVIHKTKQAFIGYKNLPCDPNSLSNNLVTGFHEDNEGYIWITTDGGGLNRFDPKSGNFEFFNTHNTNLNKDALSSIEIDKNNDIWVSSWGGGISLFIKKTKSFMSFTTESHGLSTNKTLDLIEDNIGNLWIGTANSLYKMNKKTRSFSLLTQIHTEVLKKDYKGNILIGGDIGLRILNPETQKMVNYTHDPKNKNSLSNNFVTSIFEENNVNLWIGTINGLNRLNRSTNLIDRYYKSDGLPSNLIVGIEKDDKGFLWISTNGGLSKFDPKTKKCKNYTKEDGLQGNTFIKKSHYRSRDGKMYFGGVNGFNVFDPNQVIDNTYIPPIVITDFQIFNKPVIIGEKNSPLKKHISATDELVLSYKHSVFSFGFAALNYVTSSKNQYAYMLTGFDKDWNYVGTKRSATYTNLNPGKYVFRVKGSNNDGYWNEKGASIKIIILPPWWKTWWFKTILIVFILTLMYVAYYLRVAFYRKKQKELTILVRQRTLELEQINQELLEQRTQIEEQAEELKITNEQLIERQTLIESQSEELRAHSKNLKDINDLLVDKQKLIQAQSEELKKTNEQLSVLNATKDKFFSIIGHDLRNPFNVTLGSSEVLLRNFSKLSPEKIQRFHELIYNASKSGNSLLENLLQWSRAQTGRISYEPAMLKLLMIVDETINLLQGDAQRKNISLQHTIGPDINIFADENMVKTIFRNLVSNAIKFTPEQGSITLYSVRNGTKVEITVSDTGVGISEENIKKLFRIDTTVTTKGTSNESGTGLGLILCKEFVERNNGKIWVESTHGKGSNFKFTLPLI